MIHTPRPGRQTKAKRDAETWDSDDAKIPPGTVYQQQNWQRYWRTGQPPGLRIQLFPRGIFWSRGPRGCDGCTSSYGPRSWVRFEDHRAGYVTVGWSCTGAPGSGVRMHTWTGALE